LLFCMMIYKIILYLMCIGMIYHQVEFIYSVFTRSTSFMLQGRGFI
jgi:hypothetical protein